MIGIAKDTNVSWGYSHQCPKVTVQKTRYDGKNIPYFLLRRLVVLSNGTPRLEACGSSGCQELWKELILTLF